MAATEPLKIVTYCKKYYVKRGEEFHATRYATKDAAFAARDKLIRGLIHFTTARPITDTTNPT
jgi:hypothetical protein